MQIKIATFKWSGIPCWLVRISLRWLGAQTMTSHLRQTWSREKLRQIWHKKKTGKKAKPLNLWNTISNHDKIYLWFHIKIVLFLKPSQWINNIYVNRPLVFYFAHNFQSLSLRRTPLFIFLTFRRRFTQPFVWKCIWMLFYQDPFPGHFLTLFAPFLWRCFVIRL